MAKARATHRPHVFGIRLVDVVQPNVVYSRYCQLLVCVVMVKLSLDQLWYENKLFYVCQ